MWLAVFLLSISVSVNAQTRTVPDWTLETPDGVQVRLSEKAQEKVVVLFFWATWCPYCKALMPHLQSIWFQYGDAVEILAINIFEDGDPEAFIQSHGYNFTLLLNGNAVAERYKITGTPGVLVVDRAMLSRFDLRSVPPPRLRAVNQSDNRSKAAGLAPYWAAEIRDAVARVLREERQSGERN